MDASVFGVAVVTGGDLRGASIKSEFEGCEMKSLRVEGWLYTGTLGWDFSMTTALIH